MLNECTRCTTRYSIGAPRCPHCDHPEAVVVGSPEHERLAAGRVRTSRRQNAATA